MTDLNNNQVPNNDVVNADVNAENVAPETATPENAAPQQPFLTSQPVAPQPPVQGQAYQPPQYSAPQEPYQHPMNGAPAGYYKAPVQHIYTPPAGYFQKSRLAAALLGISFGFVGCHNFYLGFKTKAIIQLVLAILGIFTFGITLLASAVWAFVEGILLLIGNENQRFDGNGVILKE